MLPTAAAADTRVGVSAPLGRLGGRTQVARLPPGRPNRRARVGVAKRAGRPSALSPTLFGACVELRGPKFA